MQEILQEIISIECQNLFSGENKKTISKCRLLKYLRVLRVKKPAKFWYDNLKP